MLRIAIVDDDAQYRVELLRFLTDTAISTIWRSRRKNILTVMNCWIGMPEILTSFFWTF